MIEQSQIRRRFGKQAILAVVFTDIIGFTVMNGLLGNKESLKRTKKYYAKVRFHARCYGGVVVKLEGDGCLIVFSTAEKALLFSIALLKDTGHPSISVRAAFHVGPVHVFGEDIFGVAVNYTKRVEETLKAFRKGPAIGFSETAKSQIEQQLGRSELKKLGEIRRLHHNGLKGFRKGEVLWEIVTPEIKAWRLGRTLAVSQKSRHSEAALRRNGDPRGR